MALFERDGIWYIDYYDGSRRIREAVGPDKKLAKEALRIRMGEVARRKFGIGGPKEPVLFDNFAQTYLEYSKTNKGVLTHRRDRSLINNLLVYFSGQKMDAITPYSIEQYKLERLKKVSKTTVNRELACLRHMFNLGIEWGKWDVNPVQKVRFFKEEPTNFKILSFEEANRLIAHCSPHFRPLVVMALNTGMRRAEILNLKWKNLDLKNRIITVEKTKAHDIRRIPINDPLYKELIALPHYSDYVFAHPNGQPFKDFRKAFHNARKRAGLEHFRFHDLRHTFASQLVMAGEDLVTVQRLMGHKTIEMTMRYSHLSDQHRINAVNKLGNLFMNAGAKTDEKAEKEESTCQVLQIGSESHIA